MIAFRILKMGEAGGIQWHTQSRTAKSDVLRKLSPSHAYVEMHPEDSSALDLRENESVIIRSRRGQMTAVVYHAPTVRRGQVFVPIQLP